MTQCPTGKRRYGSITDAEKVLAAGVMSRRARRQETRAYKCDHCKGWHLTSQERKNP